MLKANNEANIEGPNDDLEKEKEDEEMDFKFDETDVVDAVPSGNGKMMSMYQSKEMKSMYERYGNYMILLDAIYKTTTAMRIRKKVLRQFYFYFCRSKGKIRRHYNGKNF